MNMHVSRFRTVLFVVLAIAFSVVEASAIFPFGGVKKRTYTIHGYLDRAPEKTAILDRIDVSSMEGVSRTLFITKYGSPGDVPPYDGNISRDPVRTFSVMGRRQDVSRLLGAPVGAEIEATFIVSLGSPQSLMIAYLAQPPEDTATNESR